MLAQLPRVLFAAASSGSGKTTVTCGILRSLARRGVNVCAFKCGPDYIDPLFHRSVLSTPCRNLDLYFSSEEEVRTLLAEGAGACAEAEPPCSTSNADDAHAANPSPPLAVIEGVMGYYDGLGGTTDTASAYHVACATNTPVVLIVNARGASLTLVAQLKGIIEYRKPSHIAGVILNCCSKNLAALLTPALQQECGITVLGYVPNKPEFALESRHLGLVTADEIDNLQERIDAIANTLDETINFEALLNLANHAPALEYEPHTCTPATTTQPVIAVARDHAFCFYYEESLELLRRLGARCAYFSPCAGDVLPQGCCGVYLGGGYPELHAKELQENTALAQQLREQHAASMPFFAECGGFMYLQERLVDMEGNSWRMAGVIPGDVHYTGKLTRFGYVELTAQKSGMGTHAGNTLRAHEFHYFDSSCNGNAFHAVKHTGKQWDCCVVENRLFAGFPHFYLPNCEGLARGFVEAAAAFQQEQHLYQSEGGNSVPADHKQAKTAAQAGRKQAENPKAEGVRP